VKLYPFDIISIKLDLFLTLYILSIMKIVTFNIGNHSICLKIIKILFRYIPLVSRLDKIISIVMLDHLKKLFSFHIYSELCK
jgi:hypothetical protein